MEHRGHSKCRGLYLGVYRRLDGKRGHSKCRGLYFGVYRRLDGIQGAQ
jgi:hypothetical protein